MLARVLQAFSFRRNLRSLVTADQSDFAALTGLRAFATVWIVCAHAMISRGLGKLSDAQMIELIQHGDLLLKFLQHGDLALEGFFAMSGFLIGLMLLRELQQHDRISLWRFYARRYMRLSPVYLVILGILASNPMFPNRQNAWANVIYVNNFLPPAQQCMRWTWSLAVEEQFYLALPLLLLVLRPSRVRLWSLVGLFFLALAVRAFAVWDNDLRLPIVPLYTNERFEHLTRVLYDRPHTRYGSFLCGVIAAHIYLAVPHERLAAFLNRTAVWLGPLVAVACIATMIPSPADPAAAWSPLGGFLYMTGYVYLYGACASYWILFLCVPGGPGGWFRRFMALRIFVPLARLAYVIYLVHLPVSWVVYMRTKPAHSTSSLDHLPYFGLILVISVVVATIFHLLIERPFLALRPKAAASTGITSASASTSTSAKEATAAS